MKLLNKTINHFNVDNAIIVVSTYPTKNTIHTGGGLSSYTKNTLLAIKRANKFKKIVILANIIDHEESYIEDGFLVIRCWKRSFPYFSLLQHILKFPKVRNCLLEFEFAAYGELLTASLIPLFLFILNILGKKITTVVHQAVLNLNSISTHAGLSGKSFLIKILSRCLQFYYQLIILNSHKVVTLEQTLSDRLIKISGNKIVTIPHGLYPKKSISSISAKRRLDLDTNYIYVLTFGYLGHYKGSDIIVDAFKKELKIKGKKIKLILAGGENPTQGQKPHYRGFYEDLYKKINDNDNIIHTGFVPDKRIQNYFSAADLVVFPYRTLMSASGSVSLAISYNKPFITTKPLDIYTKYNSEISAKYLRSLIKKSLSDKKILREMKKITANLSDQRNFKYQGQTYLDIIENRQIELLSPVRPAVTNL